MDRALASAAAALALAALSLALQVFKLEALGRAVAAVAAGGEEELGRFPVGETPWAQRLLQVFTVHTVHTLLCIFTHTVWCFAAVCTRFCFS